MSKLLITQSLISMSTSKVERYHMHIVNINVFIYLWFQAECQPSDASFPA